jgi:hypothetical protein
MSAGRDPTVAAAHVRFAPKADKEQIVSVCLLSANSDVYAPQQTVSSHVRLNLQSH